MKARATQHMALGCFKNDSYSRSSKIYKKQFFKINHGPFISDSHVEYHFEATHRARPIDDGFSYLSLTLDFCPPPNPHFRYFDQPRSKSFPQRALNHPKWRPYLEIRFLRWPQNRGSGWPRLLWGLGRIFSASKSLGRKRLGAEQSTTGGLSAATKLGLCLSCTKSSTLFIKIRTKPTKVVNFMTCQKMFCFGQFFQPML